MTTIDFKMPRSRLKSATNPRTVGELIYRYSKFKQNRTQAEALYPWASRFVMGFPLPSWQRDSVWTDEQKIRFIISIWTEGDLGSYLINEVPELFYEDARAVVRSRPFADCLLDGQQRLSAIQDYVDDKIAVPDDQGVARYYVELSNKENRFFRNRAFSATTVSSEDERELREIYDLRAFGGVNHEPHQRAIKQEVAEQRLAYHISPAKNVASILEGGLIPTVGERSARFGEGQPAVYLLNCKQACEDALMNWLGEQFDEDEALFIFEVDVTGLQLEQSSDCSWEISVTTPIEASRIISVQTENWLLSADEYTQRLESHRDRNTY